jgi:uncharacterized protein
LPLWVEVLTFWLTLLFMLVGLFGLIIPVFPGIAVIWIAALIYGIVMGFNAWAIVFMILITIGFVVGVSVDNVLMGAGARVGGASWLTIFLGAAAGIIGTFLLPPFGGWIAAPLTIFLLEYLRIREWRAAYQATRGLIIGWGLSFLVRFGIGLLMISVWLIWAFSQNG